MLHSCMQINQNSFVWNNIQLYMWAYWRIWLQKEVNGACAAFLIDEQHCWQTYLPSWILVRQWQTLYLTGRWLSCYSRLTALCWSSDGWFRSCVQSHGRKLVFAVFIEGGKRKKGGKEGNWSINEKTIKERKSSESGDSC